MKLAEIKNPINALSGIGSATAKLFAKLNVFTVADLLQFYPKEYDDRTKRVPLKNFAYEKIHTAAKVIAHEWFGYGKMRTLKLIINDGVTTASLVAFGRAFLEKSFPVGCIISVTGNFCVRYGELQCSQFEAVKLIDDGDVIEFAGTLPDDGVIPVYHLTEGLKQKNVRKAISSALKQYGAFIDDELPQDVISARKLLPKRDALRLLHEPKKMADADAARHTLIYEELFHFQATLAKRAWEHSGKIPSADISKIADSVSLANIRASNDVAATNGEVNDTAKNEAVDEAFRANFFEQLSPLQKKLAGNLPFALTADQMHVITEINDDLDKGYRERAELSNENHTPTERPVFTMQRLLQGDVGSGKTIVALFACLRVINWRGQCAIMAPTELLAKQHAESTAKLLEPLGVRIAFLSGNVKSSGRKALLAALKSGDIDIVVGTHALFSAAVIYNDLQLAVIDEQHRFGVLQRQAIIEKGRRIEGTTSYTLHLLMMSATPIPQTLALTVFGDLDVSVLKAMPQGRKPIKTYLVREGNEANAYEAVRKELQAGHQAYFVYPAIEGEEIDTEYVAAPRTEKKRDGLRANLFDESSAQRTSRKSAEEMFAFLQSQVYPQYKCALVHSHIEEAAQEQIFRDFRAGKIQVLAATTVIEVGIDVPNSTCIVIEQADYFGLAQLHQLRGRVGRNDLQSFCFLIYSKAITDTGIERMKVLRESTDGFYIAEQDLRLRGPGEMTGTVQAGNIMLGIADIVRDRDTLIQARHDAFDWVRENVARPSGH